MSQVNVSKKFSPPSELWELGKVSTSFVKKRGRSLQRVDTNVESSMSCLELILAYLRPRDLARVACVCLEWSKAASDDSIWEEICKRQWPAIRSPHMINLIMKGGGFKHLYGLRISGPTKLQIPMFELEDLIFFLDVSMKNRVILSHVFKYFGGFSWMEFSPDSFVDENVLLPPSSFLDSEDFRKTLEVNLTILRHTDKKGVCILKGPPDRCGQALLHEDHKKSKNGLKLGFHTALGGRLGLVFYGMLNIDIWISVKTRKFENVGNGVSTARKHSVEEDKKCMEERSSLDRAGGTYLDISALRDRLGGTVKVHIEKEELLVLLSNSDWR